MPLVDDETKVIRDITRWQSYTQVPDIASKCVQAALWEPFLKQSEEVNRNETLVMALAAQGIFERLHFLMGFEDTLINFITEPEATHDLCTAIGDTRVDVITTGALDEEFLSRIAKEEVVLYEQ